MKWSAIKVLSCCSTMSILHEDDSTRGYDIVFPLTGNQEAMRSNVIYFATTSQYSQRQYAPAMTFILLHDKKDTPLPQVEGGNIAVFISREDFDRCMKELVDELSIFHKLERGASKIFELVAANAGIQAIIDAIATLYDAPASIIGNSYIPIAWSQSVIPRTQRLRNTWNHFTAGTMSEVALTKIRNTQIMHPVGKIEQTRRWDNAFQDEVVSNYLTMIYINNIAVASFSVLYNNYTLSEAHLTFLPLIAKALSLEMQKSDFYVLNKATYFTQILSHMLMPGNQLSLPDLETQLFSFGYCLRPIKYVLYADILDFTLHHHQVHVVASSLQELFANSIYLIQESGIVFLMSRDVDDMLEEGCFSEWREMLYSMGLRVGISNPFNDPSDTSRGLKQAQHAIEAGHRSDPSECLFSFQNYQIADLIVQLSKVTDLTTYLYFPLRWLIEYDMRKKTNLTHTLYLYLKHSRQTAKVCEVLFIHKNTLYYRLEKIRSIMHADIDDSRVVLQIMVSFEIMKYQGEFERLPK